MRNILKYKEFIGSVNFMEEDQAFYGRIEAIPDLVTFEGSSVEELTNSFHEAVDDYLDLCQEVGKNPYKSFKGSFNVRINPDLHRKAFEKAKLNGQTLNQFIQKAIEHAIEG